MTQIVIDAALRSKLRNLNESVELCDETGRVLARLIPVLDQSQFERVEPNLSTEELERRRREPDYSTQEVLKYLENL